MTQRTVNKYIWRKENIKGVFIPVYIPTRIEIKKYMDNDCKKIFFEEDVYCRTGMYRLNNSIKEYEYKYIGTREHQ